MHRSHRKTKLVKTKPAEQTGRSRQVCGVTVLIHDSFDLLSEIDTDRLLINGLTISDWIRDPAYPRHWRAVLVDRQFA